MLVRPLAVCHRRVSFRKHIATMYTKIARVYMRRGSTSLDLEKKLEAGGQTERFRFSPRNVLDSIIILW
jgi:hypothetical protein